MINSRAKGSQAEREFCEECVDALGIPVKRKLGAARDGGDDVELGPFSVEIKRREKVWIDNWWEQAVKNANGKTPLVAYRRNGQKWKVVMDLETFFKLAREEIVEKCGLCPDCGGSGCASCRGTGREHRWVPNAR